MDASDPIPTELEIFISLEVPEKLSKAELAQFKKIIDVYGPKNNLSSIQKTDDKGSVREVTVVRKKYKSGRQKYSFPLKRDLTESEVMKIVEAWDAYYPSGDFAVETSAEEISTKQEMIADAVVMKEDRFERLCEAIAKAQHQAWMEERLSEGWRFSSAYNRRQKTHPLLRPWHELPDKYRSIDRATPQLFMEQLTRMGYMVVGKDEFRRICEEEIRNSLDL